MRIKGISIILVSKTQTGEDAFHAPVYDYSEETVENVLVAPASSTEILDTLNLTGKKIVYNLAIPKGDTHTWEGQLVKFFGETWRVVGIPEQGIDALIPGDWNRKVQVERYD